MHRPAPRLPNLGITTTAISNNRRAACERQTQHMHQLLLSLAHTTLTKYVRNNAIFIDWLQSFSYSNSLQLLSRACSSIQRTRSNLWSVILHG